MALLVFQIEVVLGCKLTQDFVFSGIAKRGQVGLVIRSGQHGDKYRGALIARFSIGYNVSNWIRQDHVLGSINPKFF